MKETLFYKVFQSHIYKRPNQLPLMHSLDVLISFSYLTEYKKKRKAVHARRGETDDYI